MSKLIIIRGHSGSGKTTLAKRLLDSVPNSVHYEADEAFTKGDAYHFDSSRLAAAHEECLDRARMAIYAGKTVIVSNTFCMRWEIDLYTKLCEEVAVLRCVGDYQNVHGISYDHILTQKEKIQDWEGEMYVKDGVFL